MSGGGAIRACGWFVDQVMSIGEKAGASFSLATDVAPATLWPLAMDTNRLDRATGVRPSRYTYELLDPEDPLSYTRVGHTRYGLHEYHFVEVGEWTEGRSGWGERRFLRSPFLRRVGLRVALSDGRCAGESFAEPTRWLWWPIAWFVARWVRRSYLRYLRAVTRHIGTTTSTEGPLVQRARTSLLRLPAAPRMMTGPVSRVTRTELSVRARRFEEAPVDPLLRRWLVELLLTRPDETVRQLRPFELADAWGRDRREVLTALLYGVRAGLFELRWQVSCPTCRTATKVLSRLSDVQSRVHCDECDVPFATDFADHVEATFSPSRAIRRIEEVTFCAGTPWVRPHVHSQIFLQPGERRRIEHPPGTPLLVRALRGQRRLRLETLGRVRVDDEGITLVEPGDELVLDCDSPRGTTVLAVRVGLHEGPCLIVRANDRLDLFGTAVNLASRLQSTAAPGQVSVLAELLERPGIGDVLSARGVGVVQAQAMLRGLKGSFAVARVA